MTRRALLALPPLLLVLSGCDIAVDTPLGVEDVPASVTPGGPVTGTVRYPDGDITVTIGPAERGLTQDQRVSVHSPCSYDDEHFSCSTDGLEEGVYAVQVADAAQPGELVKTALVAVSSRADYAPRITTDPEHPAAREDVDAVLTGWGADRDVVVVVARNGRVLDRSRLRTDAAGRTTVRLGKVRGSAYEVRVSDGLWGGEAPAFRVWLPS